MSLGLRRRISRPRQLQPHRHDVLGRKPEFKTLEVQEAPNHQARAGEKDDSQRELDHDHRAAEPARAPIAHRAAAALLQDLVAPRPGHVQCRRQPEKQGGEDTDPRDVAKHDGVDTEVDPERLAGIGDGGIESGDPRVGEEEAQAAADDGEDQALEQKLPDDAPAGSAERRSHADLPRAGSRAREQEIGDVRASDEQDEADGAHHGPEHRLGRAADVALGEGLDTNRGDVLVVLRVGSNQTFGDGIHLAPSFLPG